MKVKAHSFKLYLILTVISVLIWCTIFYLKGIFPFGNNSVVYADFGEIILPIYYHLYDCLHGNASLIFTWKVGMGMDICGLIGELSLLSPINLIFLVIPRGLLYSFMGIYTVIKAIACSLSMHYFLRRRYSIPIVWNLIFSLLYEFSACVFLYYQLSFIIDIAFLFPILMKGFYDFWDGKDSKIYSIFLALIFGINIYMAMMVAFFLFTYVLIISVRRKDKETKVRIKKWIIDSVFSVGISAMFWFYPLCGMLSSGRMSSYSGAANLINMYCEAVKNEDWGFVFKKYILVNTGILWILILCYIKSLHITVKSNWKKISEKSRKLFAIIVVMIISIIIPGIELLWHMGSRISYPVRFVFIFTFVIIECAANSVLEIQLQSKRVDSKLIQRGALIFVIATSIIWGSRWISPVNEDYRRNDYLVSANNVDFNESTDPLVRLREKSGVMHANYSLITGSNSVGQLIHIVPSNFSEIFKNFGYTKYGHKTGENGGTIFSDLLLGINGWISYEGIEEYNKVFPNAMLLKKNVELSSNAFANQNFISEALTGMEVIEYKQINNNAFYQEIGEKSYVYFWGNCDEQPISIKVNGKIIDIPSWGQWDNKEYPAYYNSGIIDLGTFSDTTISVAVMGDDGINSEMYVGIIRESVIDAINSELNKKNIVNEYSYGKRSLALSVSTEESGILYIPITYNSNWKVYLNGEKAVPVSILGGLMGIPISIGSSEIEMNYSPNYITIGIAITIVFALVYLFYRIVDLKGRLSINTENFMFVFFIILGIIFATFMYLIPIAHFAVMRFIKLLNICL